MEIFILAGRYLTMIVFQIPWCLAFLLIVNVCVAQNTLLPDTSHSCKSYNNIFDTLVVHDTTAPLIEYTGSWPGAKKQDMLKQLLNDNEHTDEEMFWYLHSVSSDTTLNIPKAIADTIKYLEVQPGKKDNRRIF